MPEGERSAATGMKEGKHDMDQMTICRASFINEKELNASEFPSSFHVQFVNLPRDINSGK